MMNEKRDANTYPMPFGIHSVPFKSLVFNTILYEKETQFLVTWDNTVLREVTKGPIIQLTRTPSKYFTLLHSCTGKTYLN